MDFQRKGRARQIKELKLDITGIREVESGELKRKIRKTYSRNLNKQSLFYS